MMAYSSGFALSVVSNGKPLREINENNQRVVRLPFDSEYKIRIKNNHSVRCYARILIDGTEVLAGKLVMPAYGQLDVERFSVDGDLTKGKKFKFVSAGHSEVQDPTAKENGIIEVIFEKEVDSYTWTTSGSTIITNENTNGTITTTSISIPKGPIARGTMMGSDVMYRPINDTGAPVQINHCAADTGSVREPGSVMDSMGLCSERGRVTDTGATIQGGESRQRFAYSNESFPVCAPVSISIRMKGMVDSSKWVMESGHVAYKGNVIQGVESYEVSSTHLILKIPKGSVRFI